MFDRDVLRALATADPGQPMLSVYARTDPRDPANTGHSPAWEIALRNGLRAVADRLEAGEDRALRLAFRKLRERVENELVRLDPAQRGRSVAWFVEADGGDSRRLSLQLPVRDDTVVWDRKPFVSPLVDVADRGAATGVVLVGLEQVRLLQVEQGEVAEPEHSSFELTLGDWRPFRGAAGGGPARGRQQVTHQERFEARVEKQRDRLFEAAATATAKRLDALGWERVILVGDHEVAARFREVAPAALDERVATAMDVNLGHEDPAVVAATIEPHLDDLWRREAVDLAERAHARAASGGAASLGPQETLAALAEGRVAHLVLDPDRDFGPAATGPVLDALGGPVELLGERAVEAAIASGARVTALPAAASERLEEAGGMLGLLRY